LVGGAACLEFSVRKVGTAALRVGDSTIWVGGEDGALGMLLVLDSEEMEE
jgi:hypothetical protein